MQKYVKTEHANYMRDVTTGAIINTNESEYNTVVAMRRKNAELSEVKKQLEKMKTMLLTIMEKNV